MTNDEREALIAEARQAVLTMDYERAYQGGLVSRLADALETVIAVFEQAHTPTDDEPEQTEFYEVMGGQGLRRIAKNLTREEAEAVRDKFDHDCAAYGLFNPPTRINKQHGRY